MCASSSFALPRWNRALALALLLFPVAPRVLTHALAAFTEPGSRVHNVVGMSLRAGVFSGVVSRNTSSATNVLGLGDDFHVTRVHAPTITAQVVNDQSFGDLAPQQFPCPAVNVVRLGPSSLGVPEACRSVAIFRNKAAPVPALLGVAEASQSFREVHSFHVLDTNVIVGTGQ